MIPSFYPTETWVMRIFPYLVNLDITINESINFIIPLLLLMEFYEQHFFLKCHCKDILKINKIKIFPFILKLCGNTYPYSAKAYENLLLSIPKQYIITPKK